MICKYVTNHGLSRLGERTARSWDLSTLATAQAFDVGLTTQRLEGQSGLELVPVPSILFNVDRRFGGGG